METLNITTPVQVYTYGELPPEAAALVEQARQATYRSYAPYSKFKVGAAILLADGTTITGSNQENAAYPSGTCAERTACYYAHAQHPDQPFQAIAIAARDSSDDFVVDPVSPCGACRQALLEYEKLAGAPVAVWLVGRDKVYRLPSVQSTLPLAFVQFD